MDMLVSNVSASVPLLKKRKVESLAGCSRTEETEMPPIKVERPSCIEPALTCFAVAGVLSICMLVLWLFVQEWITETSYRAWLLFAGIAPLSDSVQLLWHRT